MLRKIKLYGELAKFVGYRVLEAEVRNAAEAVRFLIANFPGIEKHMSDQYYKVSAGDWQITTDELHYPTGQSDISIVPVISGAGGNFGKILLGAALIGGAFAFGGLSFGGSFKAFGANLAAAPGLTKAAFGIGSALVLSGVSDILFPLPKIPQFQDEEDPRISFSFSGVQNTSRAGTTIPLVYGEIITGSVVISAGIDTNDVTATD